MDVVGEQNVDISQLPREQKPVEPRADRNASLPAVVVVDVLVAGRIVELRRPRIDDIVALSRLTVVDGRPLDGQIRARIARWEVADDEQRLPLIILLGYGAHHEAVAVRILQSLVHPGAGLAR